MITTEKTNIPKLFLRLQELECMDENDTVSSGDGFFAEKKALSDILAARGMESFPTDDGRELLCNLFFDDWYIYSVTAEGRTVYSLFKMREQESDAKSGTEADGDTPGVTVSFIEMDTAVLLDCLDDPDTENRRKLGEEINRVAAYKKQRHSETLKKYFIGTGSKGAYLIAGLYTDFIASLAENGFVAVPEKYSKEYRKSGKSGRIARFIEENNGLAKRNICDHERIYIENPKALSEHERLAILATHCGNTSFFSFAAEVQLHAKFLASWAKIPVPFTGRNLYESAIRADMSIADAEFTGFAPYHRKNSAMIKKHIAIHRADIL